MFIFFYIYLRFSTGNPDIQLEQEKIRRIEPYQSDNLMDIGTRRIFNEEHDIFRQQVRRFMQEYCIPNCEK